MHDLAYECVDCKRLMMACPRCGRLLHYAAEPHSDRGFHDCPGPYYQGPDDATAHPDLLACVQARRELLARQQQEGVELTG